MSNLIDIFEAHKKKRAKYETPPDSYENLKGSKSKTPSKEGNFHSKKWKKNKDPNLNSERNVSDTPLDNLKVLILDTSSDSLNPQQANLFQVSLLSGDFSSGNWKEDAYRVKSVEMPTHFILSLEGEEDLFPDKKILSLEDVMSNVVDYFHDADVVIAYSSAYHIQLLGCEAKRVGFELPPIHILDPFTIYSTVYKYSRGKKFTDAIEKYGSKISDFGTPGFYSRTPLALRWLTEQMIQDDNCSKFFDCSSLSDLTREQVISSAMNYIDLKEFFSKQSNGKTITWNAWPTAPDGSNKTPDGLTEVVPELGVEFEIDPQERSQTNPVSFNYFSSNTVFQSLALGLFSDEEEAQEIKVGDCMIKSFLENGNLICMLTGKTADSMNVALSELNKFPLTSLGVSEQLFEPINTSNEDNGMLSMKLILCQK